MQTSLPLGKPFVHLKVLQPKIASFFFQDSFLQSASLTPLAFKEKATSLLAFTQEQDLIQDLGAAKDMTVVMSPSARSVTAKNIVR